MSSHLQTGGVNQTGCCNDASARDHGQTPPLSVTWWRWCGSAASSGMLQLTLTEDDVDPPPSPPAVPPAPFAPQVAACSVTNISGSNYSTVSSDPAGNLKQVPGKFFHVPYACFGDARTSQTGCSGGGGTGCGTHDVPK